MSENFSFFQIECNGQEHTLEDCKHEKTDVCGPNEGAGVVCIGSFAILRLVENLETIRILYWACLKGDMSGWPCSRVAARPKFVNLFNKYNKNIISYLRNGVNTAKFMDMQKIQPQVARVKAGKI